MVGEDLLRAFYKLFYLQFCDSSDQCERYFYMKIIITIVPTNLFTNSLLSLFYFPRNQKQESNFQQVGGPVKRNNSTFYLKRVALHFKVMQY